MAQELSKYDYILNVEHRPNKTGVLLAIPMYMYRIEMKSIEYGINFFEKAVLMVKTNQVLIMALLPIVLVLMLNLSILFLSS